MRLPAAMAVESLFGCLEAPSAGDETLLADIGQASPVHDPSTSIGSAVTR